MITFLENQQKIVDRLKTERMSQAEFEQYAKEHGYIISTTNIIEQITAEIDRQEKWLLQAGYTAYNVDIAFDSIKSVLAESEE